jgi:hypothetical protein
MLKEKLSSTAKIVPGEDMKNKSMLTTNLTDKLLAPATSKI